MLKRKTFVYFVFSIFVIIWVYVGFVFVSEWRPFDGDKDQIQLFSYESSIEQYKSSIPGLNYEKLQNDVTEMSEPNFFTVGELFSDWHPDDTSIDAWTRSKAHPRKGGGLPRFDFTVVEDYEMAQRYRNAELPFILENVPEMNRAAEMFSKQNLLNNFGNLPRSIEKSKSNHFMYYTAKNPFQTSKSFPNWEAPQQDVALTFAEFLREAEQAEAAGSHSGGRPLYYMTMSAGEGRDTSWVRQAFPFFTDQESFFIVDPDGFKGINCRFGMRGVIAEAHYDGQRNFVAMVRGRKRYVLLPPRACPNLSLLPRGHPSARHASYDWSDSAETAKHRELLQSEATEVVLSRGEMMYIPSYWFHYIISQDASIQCNARSGNALQGLKEISDCGFYKNSGFGSEGKIDGSGDGSGLKKKKKKGRRGGISEEEAAELSALIVKEEAKEAAGEAALSSLRGPPEYQPPIIQLDGVE